ncbi:hypothetical protein BD779DRAFT_1474973 [Infundibulicybe gibba]|nr:hypothetical protein BD779DRAFT_1474973 [Infundibulicybe gibba]
MVLTDPVYPMIAIYVVNQCNAGRTYALPFVLASELFWPIHAEFNCFTPDPQGTMVVQENSTNNSMNAHTDPEYVEANVRRAIQELKDAETNERAVKPYHEGRKAEASV